MTIVNNGKSPFNTVDEAITALSDGTFAEKVSNFKPTEIVKPTETAAAADTIATTETITTTETKE